jgi:hypothetical protein
MESQCTMVSKEKCLFLSGSKERFSALSKSAGSAWGQNLLNVARQRWQLDIQKRSYATPSLV